MSNKQGVGTSHIVEALIIYSCISSVALTAFNIVFLQSITVSMVILTLLLIPNYYIAEIASQNKGSPITIIVIILGLVTSLVVPANEFKDITVLARLLTIAIVQLHMIMIALYLYRKLKY